MPVRSVRTAIEVPAATLARYVGLYQLAPTFTLSELQAIYEVLLGRRLSELWHHATAEQAVTVEDRDAVRGAEGDDDVRIEARERCERHGRGSRRGLRFRLAGITVAPGNQDGNGGQGAADDVSDTEPRFAGPPAEHIEVIAHTLEGHDLGRSEKLDVDWFARRIRCRVRRSRGSCRRRDDPGLRLARGDNAGRRGRSGGRRRYA